MSDERDAAIDARLDARLRDVPLPPGLAGRVVAAAAFDDAVIDRLLARVSPPAGLGDRVRQACVATRRGLLDTPPPHAVPAATRSPWPTAALIVGMRWLSSAAADLGAVAAALAIVAAMFFAGTELSRRMAAPPPATARSAPDDVPAAPQDRRGAPRSGAPGGPGGAAPSSSGTPAELADDRTVIAATGPRRPAIAATAGAPEPAASAGAPAVPLAASAHAPAVPLAASAHAPAVPLAASAGAPAVPLAASAHAPAVAVPEVAVRASPAIADWSASGRAVGAKGMRLVTLPTVSRAVPRAKGFDTVFEMTHGESPFVDPAANPVLAEDRPPLSLRTDAFDALRESAVREASATSRRSRGPSRRGPVAGGPAGGLAVEELLAALPPPWSAAGGAAGQQRSAAARDSARLMVSGVRSLRPEPGSTLVEICAAPPPPVGYPAGGGEDGRPIDALLVLDHSASGSAPLSWSWQCRGLGRIAAAMGGDDRLSVIVCGERPRLAALRADAAAVRALLAELEAEPAAESADVDAALRLAATVARREGPPRRIVVAARMESLDRCRGEGRAALVAWRAGADPSPAAPAVQFIIVDPQESPPDPALRTDASGGSGRVAADAVAVGRAMLAGVTGRATLAATGCRLAVAFDPRVVGAYRVVGYRQTAADAVSPGGPAGVDLHAGEAVRVVYEIVPRQGSGGGTRDAVTATFTWTPPGTDAAERRQAGWAFDTRGSGGRGSAGRRDLPPPSGCELVLAVACGELASGSPHIEPRRQSLASLASFVARWKARGDVTPAGTILIDALQRLGVAPEQAGP